MSDSSFYGGKQGASIAIQEHFNSVYDLVTAFNGGGSYTKVNYGEYAIIDCPDKTSPENGILYRRGFEYNVPCVLLDEDSDFRKKYPDVEIREATFDSGNTYVIAKEGQEDAFSEYVLNPGGGAVYTGQIVGPMGDTPIVKIETMAELAEEPYVKHGYTGQGTVDSEPATASNDSIEYGYAVTTDAFGNTTGVAIAFDVPAPTISVTATAIDYDNGNTPLPLELASKIAAESGKFYSKWQISIPKGIHGQDFVALGMDEDTQQYYYLKKTYDDNYEGTVSERVYIEDSYLKSIKNIEAVYDVDEDDETIKYLKGFKVIYTTLDEEGDNEEEYYECPTFNNVNLADDGTLTITDTADVEYELGIIKWITGFDYSATTGKYTVHYNTGEDVELSQVFKAIDKIYLDNKDNKFKVDYNTGDTVNVSDTIDKISKIEYLADTLSASHKLRVTYDRGTTQAAKVVELDNPINGVEKFTIIDNYLYVLYTAPATREKIVIGDGPGFGKVIDGYRYLNLGYVKGDVGSLQYYGEYDSEDELPEGGFEGSNAGKLASVFEDNVHQIFAYDYLTNRWINLGTLDAGAIEPNKSIVVSDEEPTSLNVNGIWLVISE